MIDALIVAGVVIGMPLFVTGIGRLLLVPFAVLFELFAARSRRRGERVPDGTLSIVVPCYNEALILERCIISLAETVRPGTEIVLVDDGSTDDTWAIAQRLEHRFESVRAISQPNGGKGSALNAGLRLATGDFLLLTDADGIWLPESLDELLRGFNDPRVGAVCGDDRPVNLDVPLTKFLAVTGHVGTGLMRRALSFIRCLPIVSGNVGCFRREALAQVGPLRTDTLGEDLELTWRIAEGGWRVVMRPRAVVYAESPSTLGQLWKQRLRWARGFCQTVVHHSRAIGNPRYGIFGLSLLPLVFITVLMPLVHLLSLPVLFGLVLGGAAQELPQEWIAWLFWLGLPASAALVVLACWFDGAIKDLRFLWTLPFWPIFAIGASAVAAWGLWLELRGAEQRWDKLERGGVVSVDAARTAGSGGAEQEDDVQRFLVV